MIRTTLTQWNYHLFDSGSMMRYSYSGTLLSHRSMLVRLGHFYAFVLLLICLMIDIAFFSAVREPFLGAEDPTASIKSALSELDIPEKIAEFYPQTQSNADNVQVVTPQKEPPRQSSVPPLEAEPVKKDVPKEISKSSTPTAAPMENRQTAATIPAAKPAVSLPVIAEQFKPIVPEQKPVAPTKPVKPSSVPVWETIDSLLEQPIRHD